MPRKALRQNLEKLHAELASAENLKEDDYQLLEQVAEDIEKVLGEADAPHSLRGQVLEASARFRTEHPRLSSLFVELADALSKLGV